MSPTFVFKDGKIALVTGSPGGSRIITTVLQIILDVVDHGLKSPKSHGLNVAEAEAAPRVHDQGYPEELRIECGISPDTIRLLEAIYDTLARGDGTPCRRARSDGLGEYDRTRGRRADRRI